MLNNYSKFKYITLYFLKKKKKKANCKLYPKSLKVFGFYTLKFQNLDFTS